MQKCSYKKSFWKYAPAALEDNHAPVYCNFIEIKPQVFCKRDANFNNTLLKEHLCGGGGLHLRSAATTTNHKGIFLL